MQSQKKKTKQKTNNIVKVPCYTVKDINVLLYLIVLQIVIQNELYRYHITFDSFQLQVYLVN